MDALPRSYAQVSRIAVWSYHLAQIINFPGKDPVPRKLNEFPLIPALCPQGTGKTVSLQIMDSTISKLVQAGRRTEIFQAWVHLVGEMPPINNAELVRKTDCPDAHFGRLAEAHACFRGVNRRYDHDDNGSEVYVYVIRTGHTVRWKSDLRCVAAYYPAPPNVLLTVQAKPIKALQDCEKDVWGGLVKWEFVNADAERHEFPAEFTSRYDELVWQR
jgi:hypothetical protein